MKKIIGAVMALGIALNVSAMNRSERGESVENRKLEAIALLALKPGYREFEQNQRGAVLAEKAALVELGKRAVEALTNTNTILGALQSDAYSSLVKEKIRGEADEVWKELNIIYRQHKSFNGRVSDLDLDIFKAHLANLEWSVDRMRTSIMSTSIDSATAQRWTYVNYINPISWIRYLSGN